METDEEALFWFALAHTEWKNGRLSLFVKEKALAWIEVNGGIELLELFKGNKKTYDRWLKYVVELKEMLLSSMPPRKVYRKPIEFERNPWNIGDVYVYQFHTKEAEQKGLLNKYIVFQKIGDIELYEGEVYSVVQVFDKVFDKVPKIGDIENVRILPITNPPGVEGWPSSLEEYVPSFDKNLRNAMIRWSKNRYPEKYLSFVDNKTVPQIEYTYKMVGELDWDKDKMDEWLCDFYFKWQNVEY